MRHKAIEGLHSGIYKVTITARVADFIGGATEVAGLTFDANGNESETAWETGTNVQYATLEAYATIDETTTTLDFGFNYTAADVNFTWLIFHKAKLTYVKKLDDTTAIQTIESENSDKRVIYDLAGRRLNTLKKGIQIVNGVKVLVK